MKTADLQLIAAADFEAARDENFSLLHGGGSLDAQLVAVTPVAGSPRENGGFSLSFATAPGPFLPQAIYRLDHPRMGALEIFLVPLGPREGRNLYEAVFY